MAQASVTGPHAGRRLGERHRLGSAWGWALAGLLIVAGVVALESVAEPPALEGGPALGVSAPQDWRGNSARLPERH